VCKTVVLNFRAFQVSAAPHAEDLKGTSANIRVLQLLVQRHAADMTAAHAAAVLQALDSMRCTASDKRKVQHLLQAFGQRLLQLQLLPQLPQRALLQVSKACARYGHHNQPLLLQCLQELSGQAEQCSPHDIALLLRALAACRVEPDQQHVLALLEAFHGQLGASQPQGVAEVLMASSSLQLLQHHQPSALLQDLMQDLIDRRQQAAPRDLSMATRAAAALGLQLTSEQLQHMAAAMLDKPQLVRPAAVTFFLRAAAHMGQQLPPEQVQQLAAVLLLCGSSASTRDISSLLWAAAIMGVQLAPGQVPQLFALLCTKAAVAKPIELSWSLWAAASMATAEGWAENHGQQLLTEDQLQHLTAAIADKLPEAQPECLSHSLWACGRLRFFPQRLLLYSSAPDPQEQEQQVHRLVAGMSLPLLGNTAWACAQLNHRDGQLLESVFCHAVQQLQHSQQQEQQGCADHNAMVHITPSIQDNRSSSSSSSSLGTSKSTSTFSSAAERPKYSHSLMMQALSNLCWSIAILGLHQHVEELLLLARALVQHWGTVSLTAKSVLYQVHAWLLDCQSAGGTGLLGCCLTQQQLQECREAALSARQEALTPSDTQDQVMGVLQTLPARIWQQQPVSEQVTADGLFVVDIVAVTAAGTRLALEVDGPQHFLRPGFTRTGPSQFRDRSLAARGFKVAVVPFFEWYALQGPMQQQAYLLGKLGHQA